ncbi:hypothetical protein GBA52_014205 [Prunus armeniaca]|nr:hypothetical protein GBA52_013984 [Prunus armeniaca]KAH0987028.1 hypothetical protein GBA52_014205 [Prunus armeniaca]
MKFLLEFVSCCGIARPATIGEQAPLSEETSSLVPRRMRRRRKRGRLGNSGSTSPNSAEWRPSLTSISEDNVVAMVVDRTAEVERAVKRKSGQSRTIAQVRSHGEDYGRASLTTAIPAFSPTPFMF